jgi:hypothetical protein
MFELLCCRHLQLPETHEPPGPQKTPQDPQLLASLFTQVLSQNSLFDGQLHCLDEQVLPVSVQLKALPQPPQLELSVLKLVQVPAQASGVLPEQTQAPVLEQVRPLSVQSLQLVPGPQESGVLLQTHELLEQCFPLPQGLPQPPQWLLLDVVSTQLPLQSFPDEQVQLPVPVQTLPAPHALSFTQCPVVSQCWGTGTVAALHFFSPGVQSAQALVAERQSVQGWVLWAQVPWLLQVPASWSSVELRQLAVPQGIEVLAGTQSGLEPVQEALQGAVPPQDLPARGEVV